MNNILHVHASQVSSRNEITMENIICFSFLMVPELDTRFQKLPIFPDACYLFISFDFNRILICIQTVEVLSLQYQAYMVSHTNGPAL